MASRFFPNGGNGRGNADYYKPKPGDILPLFDAGLLTFTVENGATYIRVTEEGQKRIDERDGYGSSPKTKK